MIDEVEVTERGEIVARCIRGEAWTEPHSDGHVWLHVEDEDNARIVASALVPRGSLAAWCRRVLREVDPDPVPTVDEVMAAWGIDDLRMHVSRYNDGTSAVCVNSDAVSERWLDLEMYDGGMPRPGDGDDWPPVARGATLLGKGSAHAEALVAALRSLDELGAILEEWKP